MYCCNTEYDLKQLLRKSAKNNESIISHTKVARQGASWFHTEIENNLEVDMNLLSFRTQSPVKSVNRGDFF